MGSGERTVYEVAGGDTAFARLVDAFYRGVEADPLLRPMYPAELAEAREHLFLFLTHFFGGPSRYEALRGHPRLRMRHLPFRIGEPERDAWLRHMRSAVDETGIPEPARQAMLEYFERAANFLMNQPC